MPKLGTEGNPVMGYSLLADIITSLTILQQTEHEALLLREHEQHMKHLLDAQAADQEVLQGLVQWASIAVAVTVAMAHVPLAKMGMQDDWETFLELYVCSTVAWGWPRGSVTGPPIAAPNQQSPFRSPAATGHQYAGTHGPETGNFTSSRPHPGKKALLFTDLP